MTVPGSTPGPEMGVPTVSAPPCTLLTVSVLPEMLPTKTGDGNEGEDGGELTLLPPAGTTDSEAVAGMVAL